MFSSQHGKDAGPAVNPFVAGSCRGTGRAQTDWADQGATGHNSLPANKELRLQSSQLRVCYHERNRLRFGLSSAATEALTRVSTSRHVEPVSSCPFPSTIFQCRDFHVINMSSSVSPTWVSVETPCAQLTWLGCIAVPGSG